MDKKAYLEGANNILFALYERSSALKQFQRGSIDPHRNDQFKEISMRPILDFSYPESEFRVEESMLLEIESS
jgi:hypothetical protein